MSITENIQEGHKSVIKLFALEVFFYFELKPLLEGKYILEVCYEGFRTLSEILIKIDNEKNGAMLGCRGVVTISTAQLYLTKPELSFCECSNPACGVFRDS